MVSCYGSLSWLRQGLTHGDIWDESISTKAPGGARLLSGSVADVFEDHEEQCTGAQQERGRIVRTRSWEEMRGQIIWHVIPQSVRGTLQGLEQRVTWPGNSLLPTKHYGPPHHVLQWNLWEESYQQNWYKSAVNCFLILWRARTPS